VVPNMDDINGKRHNLLGGAKAHYDGVSAFNKG
jgi:hypothetical protein